MNKREAKRQAYLLAARELPKLCHGISPKVTDALMELGDEMLHRALKYDDRSAIRARQSAIRKQLRHQEDLVRLQIWNAGIKINSDDEKILVTTKEG